MTASRVRNWTQTIVPNWGTELWCHETKPATNTGVIASKNRKTDKAHQHRKRKCGEKRKRKKKKGEKEKRKQNTRGDKEKEVGAKGKGSG